MQLKKIKETLFNQSKALSQKTGKNRNGFTAGGHFSVLVFPGLFFPLVLHLARVRVTAVNERRCGDLTEVTRDVKLLQGGTSIHPIV